MLPLVLAAVGGYLIADSLKKDSNKFADGGKIESPNNILKNIYKKQIDWQKENSQGGYFPGWEEGSSLLEYKNGYAIKQLGDSDMFGDWYTFYSKKGEIYNENYAYIGKYNKINGVILKESKLKKDDFDETYPVSYKWNGKEVEMKKGGVMADGGMMAMGGTTETLRKFDDGGMTDKKIEGLESALNNPNLSPKVKRQLKMKLNEMKAIKEGRYSDESKYGKFDDGGEIRTLWLIKDNDAEMLMKGTSRSIKTFLTKEKKKSSRGEKSVYGLGGLEEWYEDTTKEQVLKHNRNYSSTDQSYAEGGKVKSKKWIQEALSGGKNKGALRRTAKNKGLLRGDENLSATDLKKLQKMGGTTAKRAHLAETLRKLK